MNIIFTAFYVRPAFWRYTGCQIGENKCNSQP